MRSLTIFLWLLLSTMSMATAAPQITELTKSNSIVWDSSLALPGEGSEPHLGLAGAFSGFIGEELLIAGGANFPKGLPSEGGEKQFYADLFIYTPSKAEWRTIANVLPQPMAYGISIPIEDGFLCIGGCDAERCIDEVFAITLNGTEVEIKHYPSLPIPLANAAGCCIGSKIYVAGGIERVVDAKATSHFLMLDLNHLDRGWKTLISWPGPSRAFAVATAQSDGFDNCFYLFGGRNFEGNNPWQVLEEGYRYNPRLDKWELLKGSFRVMAGTALPFGTNHILLLGGRDAENSDEGLIRLYHTVTGSLIEEPLPEGVTLPVTTNALRKGESLFITSGEVAPGVRTPIITQGRLDGHIHRMTWLDITIIVLYFFSLAYIGWHFSKNQKSSEDYFKGGGRIPWFIVGLSIFGTALSAITFMAIPAKAYATDWSYMLFNAGIILCVPVIVMLFIPFYRKLNVTTAYEYLEARFNKTVRILCSIAFILFQIGRMGVVLLLPAIALNIVTGFDIFLCITLMGILSLLYTLMGGIEAVAWTDALQVVVLLGAAIAVLVIVCFQLPEGASTLLASASEMGKYNLGSLTFDLRESTVWTVLIATFFTNITTYGTDQTIVQRYLATATEKEARKGVYVNAVLTIPATVLFFLVGTALWAFYRYFPEELSMSISDSDAILPWYMSTQLPSGVVGLVIAGLFAAAMSTLSSSMNSAATAYVTDIYRKIKQVEDGDGLLRTARLSTLILGLVGIGFAVLMATWEIKSLWDEFSKILGILLGGLGGLFLLGLTTRRANAFGALCGIAASIVVQTLVAQSGYVHLLLYSTTGFVSCYVVGYLASLFVKTDTQAVEKLTIYGDKKS